MIKLRNITYIIVIIINSIFSTKTKVYLIYTDTTEKYDGIFFSGNFDINTGTHKDDWNGFKRYEMYNNGKNQDKNADDNVWGRCIELEVNHNKYYEWAIDTDRIPDNGWLGKGVKFKIEDNRPRIVDFIKGVKLIKNLKQTSIKNFSFVDFNTLKVYNTKKMKDKNLLIYLWESDNDELEKMYDLKLNSVYPTELIVINVDKNMDNIANYLNNNKPDFYIVYEGTGHNGYLIDKLGMKNQEKYLLVDKNREILYRGSQFKILKNKFGKE